MSDARRTGWHSRVPLALLAGLFLGGVARGQDALSPGLLLADEPTVQAIGLRWLVTGDDNRDATASVFFRRAGGPAWREALPLLRIHGETAGQFDWICGNHFAGSVLGLEPGTTYQIRVVLDDPDGVLGETERTLATSTRPRPSRANAGQTLHVYPDCQAGGTLDPCYEDLVSAAQDAEPGDEIFIHEGTYPQNGTIDLTFLASKATSPTLPIVFRGERRDTVVFDRGFPSDSTDQEPLFLVSGTRHLHFLRFSVVDAGHAFVGENAEGLVIRGLRLDRVRMGVIGSDADVTAADRGWYVADNQITGRNPVWYPYDDRSNAISHTGVRIYGRGHVVERNEIGRFWDCVAHANTGGGLVNNDDIDWRDPPALDVDVTDNELYECYDDGLEADFGFHNFRYLRNRITNGHTALSVQPFYCGPVYLIRNVADNIAANSFKFHNQPAGIEAYHNTLLVNEFAWESDGGWLNARIRNNLVMGVPSSNSVSVRTGSPAHPLTVLDHNAYTASALSVTMIRWNRGAYGESDWLSYLDLAALFAGEGHEEHGLEIDYSVLESASHPPGEGSTFLPGQQDLRPSAGSALVDHGTVLPTINEGFAGAGPDLGACERGETLPAYGPGPAWTGSPSEEAFCDGDDEDADGTVDGGCDDDGDGYCDREKPLFGSPAACPAGGGDCDDGDGSTHPGAAEINDGKDNQCLGEAGHGVADETSGVSGFPDTADETLYCWTAQTGASEYEVRRSSWPRFLEPCMEQTTAATCWSDPAVPPPGQAFFYLNRPALPRVGSWGQDSELVERTGICGAD
jgi:hypothetical protein